MPKMKLSFRELLDRVRYVIKTIQDNVMTNRIGLIYVETKTELLRPIEQGTVSYEDQTDQRHDRSYKCDLC